MPDSLFPKVSPIPYHRPGTPYRKVSPPGTDTEVEPETVGAGILDKPDDSFEVDSESERTLTEEPKTPKKPENPKFEKSISGMPEGITKRKFVPVVLPFTKDPKSKIESKVIVRLKKIDIDTQIDSEKRPLADPKKLKEKGSETKVEIIEQPVGNPGKGPVKKAKDTEKPHERPLTEAAAAPSAPVVRSPSKTPSASPLSILSSLISTPPLSPPLIPLVLLVGPVAMGMVEDYFQNYNIRDQAQKCNRFRDTCCAKARTWLSTLTEYPTIFDPEAAPDEAGKAKTMKSMFLARWQLKGRTPQTLYMEWQNLKFDPAKYDIEDFCNDVKNLANRLGYPKDAQVMAINATLPPVLVTQVINVKTFKEIRDTLIKLVENPVIKRVLLTEGTGEKGLVPFSQMQWQPENVVGMCDPEARQLREEGERQTPKSLGKIIKKMDNLELKMRKMSISDEKGKEPPYKPQVAPPKCRGGNRFRGMVRNPKAALTYSNRENNGFKRNNGRPQSNFQSSSSRGTYRG